MACLLIIEEHVLTPHYRHSKIKIGGAFRCLNNLSRLSLDSNEPAYKKTDADLIIPSGVLRKASENGMQIIKQGSSYKGHLSKIENRQDMLRVVHTT